MDDRQKWMEAAAGIEQDIEYLRVALAVYRKNAENGVPWPSPDDLYCIQTMTYGSHMQTSDMVRARR